MDQRENLQTKPIILLGMMGCGKSVVGEELAKQLGVAFWDSDSVIEKSEGKKISAIFSEEGESFFRDLEQQTISDLVQKNNVVISSGGGAVTNSQTMKNIKARAVSIWLAVDVDTLEMRLRDDSSRPLLKGQDLKSRLEELLSVREKLYAQADIHIDNSSKNVDEVVAEIIQELKNYAD